MIRASVGVAILLAGLAGVEPAGAQSREFNQTVNLNAGGSLRVDGSIGSIRITSWDKPQVEIRARIEAPDDVSDEYARQAVEATAIDVTGDQTSVTVASNYERVPHLRLGRWGSWGNNDRREPPVHYDIRAPRSLRLSIDSDRGPAMVQGFEGAVDVVVDRGELTLKDVSGDIRINIDRGGQSSLDDVRGSVEGDADRTDLRITAHALDRDSRIEIDRGDVEVSVPGAQRLTVRTEISRRGDFHADFPIEWSSSDPRRSRGRINGGGTELLVNSDRGHVRLRRR